MEITKEKLQEAINDCYVSLVEVREVFTTIKNNPYRSPELFDSYEKAIFEHEYWIAVHKLAIVGLSRTTEEERSVILDSSKDVQ